MVQWVAKNIFQFVEDINYRESCAISSVNLLIGTLFGVLLSILIDTPNKTFWIIGFALLLGSILVYFDVSNPLFKNERLSYQLLGIWAALAPSTGLVLGNMITRFIPWIQKNAFGT